jgi:hypothetical protein
LRLTGVPKRLRGKSKFVSRINVQILRENISLLFFRNLCFGLAIPSHQEGVSRSSRTLERDAVDATMSCAHEIAGRGNS